MENKNETTIDATVRINASMRSNEVEIETAREIYNFVTNNYEEVDQDKKIIRANNIEVSYTQQKDGQIKFKFECIFGNAKKNTKKKN